MRGEQLCLWEDEKQIILEREKVDISTLKTLKTRTNAWDLLPKDTYFIYKTGGINPHKKEWGPIFPVIKNSRGKILSQNPLTSGKDAPYPHLFIQGTVNGKTLTFKCFLHKVTALAFLKNNNFEHKYIIDHVDGDIFNYLPENLEWVTHSQNAQRRYSRKK